MQTSYVTFTTTTWQRGYFSSWFIGEEAEAEAAVTHGNICPPGVLVSTSG